MYPQDQVQFSLIYLDSLKPIQSYNPKTPDEFHHPIMNQLSAAVPISAYSSQ